MPTIRDIIGEAKAEQVEKKVTPPKKKKKRRWDGRKKQKPKTIPQDVMDSINREQLVRLRKERTHETNRET